MYPALLHTHSGLRWILLILLLWSVYNGAMAMTGKSGVSASAKKISLFTLIATHLQFVLGLGLYFVSPKVQFSGETMGNGMLRFFTMEHSVMMLIAITLITFANRAAKSGNGKKMFWFYFIALVVVLAGIPWPFRVALGGNWF